MPEEEKEMKCPSCGSDEIEEEVGYKSIFRCKACKRIGNDKDFGEGAEWEKKLENMNPSK